MLSKLQLRTKLLSSVVIVIAGLTSATLLVVRRNAQVQVERQIQEEMRNGVLTFQVMQQQHQIALGNKADLVANLALMRNGDAATIQDVGEDPWQSPDCDLFALADSKGTVVALHTRGDEFPLAAAQKMLRRSLRAGTSSGWWYSGVRLYQVSLQSFYDDPPINKNHLGTVIVGRGINARELSDLRRISSSEIALRYDDEIVSSTLGALEAQDLLHQIQNGEVPESVQIGAQRYSLASLPLTPGPHPEVSLVVLKSDADAMASLTRLNRLLLALALMAVLTGGALVFIISDRITRPLASLLGGVRALEEGNVTYPLEAHGGDETAQLTRAFDGMRSTLRRNELQRRTLEESLRQSQKMEAIGRLAGGVAHDFNNLLTVIKGHSSLLLDQLKPSDPLQGSSRQIEMAADRAASLTRQLLAFCRMQVLQPQIVDLNALVSDMSKMLIRLIREDIAFNFRPADSLQRVKADAGQIEQIVLNLTVNACDAMPTGGELIIETQNVWVDANFAQD